MEIVFGQRAWDAGPGARGFAGGAIEENLLSVNGTSQGMYSEVLCVVL